MFEKFYFVPFLSIREAMALFVNNLIMLGRLIQSFRHLEDQNQSIILDSIGRYRMLCKSDQKKKEYHQYKRGYLLNNSSYLLLTLPIIL